MAAKSLENRLMKYSKLLIKTGSKRRVKVSQVARKAAVTWSSSLEATR